MRSRPQLNYEPLEERLLFSIAPTLAAVITNIPNDGDILSTSNTTVLQQAPQQLVLKFDSGQIIDSTASKLASGIQIVRSGGDGVFGAGGTIADVPVVLGYEGVPEQSNQVVLRFLNTLPDDTYQIKVTNAITNTAGQALSNPSTITFKIDYGAQVSAVVPQPVTRAANGTLQQSLNTIQVYFTNNTLATASAQDPTLYQLINTQGTATTNDDSAPINPQSVVYDPVKNMATLTFANSLSTYGLGTYRLRIGDNAINAGTTNVVVGDPQHIAQTDAGSSFGTADNVGTLTSQTMLLTGGTIDAPGTSPTDGPYNIIFPGSVNDPGQRNIPAEQHIFGPADSSPGIQTLYYNFQSDYGLDPLGNQLINQITEQQKTDVRDIFAMYGKYLGVQFIETPTQGLTIATGDPRAVDPTIPVTSVGGIAGGGVAVMNNNIDWGTSAFGSGYYTTAMHEIGHLIGLGHSYELPPGQIMGSTAGTPESGQNPNDAEPVYPGDFDILDAQYLYRPESKDIDIYKFTLTQGGTFSAEAIAQRNPVNSLLNSVLTLYDAAGNMLARNDNYFGNDSFLNLPNLASGTYYIAVSSTGNTNFNPNVTDSGYGGTTQGAYDLRLNLVPVPPAKQLLDVGGQPLDGDLNGVAGGDFNFWFQVGNAGNTRFVDKQAANGGNGTIASPYNTIAAAFNAANPGDIVRVVGNGGADNNVATLGDNLAYEIGTDIFGNPLSDGATMNVPKGVTVMIDAGALFKLRSADINAGTISQGVDLSGGAIQVLGTPTQSVYFTSYNNESMGVDTNPLHTVPSPGDWGGLAFQNDSDHEAQGIFANYVAHADISYGGGTVVVDSQPQVIDPIHLVTSRPTIIFNNIHDNADAAISANPDSFEYSLIEGNDPTNPFTADYSRIGPTVYGNILARDSINGLFIRIRTNAGSPIDVLDVTGRLTSTDIVYVIPEVLEVAGKPGGPLLADDKTTVIDPHISASLIIDPGVVIKSQGARIEVGLTANLIAEGTSAKPIIFTSLNDDTYGAGGVFDTTGDGAISHAAPGDWSGFYFDPSSTGSIDHAVITYAGGVSAIEGGFARFNTVEIYQATVRIADSVLEQNAEGYDESNRNGRFSTGAATIYILGAQPSIVNNIIRKNAGDAISVNANSLNTNSVPDWGRSTGPIARVTTYDDNFGPLIRGNVLDGNDINGMEVRGAVLTTQSVWDDVDIVHVLKSDIDVPNFESVGGLELKSSPTASLVVKLAGTNAGFTADGAPLDISNRIGGAVQVLGMPGHAVILTSLSDQTVGAGVDLSGNLQVNTIGNGLQSAQATSKMTINFIFGPGVPLAAQQTFLEAAKEWEQVLDDPITLTFDIGFGGLPAGVAGETLPVQTTFDYNDVRAKMIANKQANDAFITGLPTFSQLQSEVVLPPGFTLSNQVTVTRADALALGYNPSQLPTQVSQFNGTTTIDGTLTFDATLPYDYNRADGINGLDFLSITMHELGHALGFDSAVDEVDAGVGTVSMTPLDMFRLAPGQGATNFTGAQRILTPGPAGSQVFYDGGQFDLQHLQPPNATVGDIPLSTGTNFGDGFQASHWENRDLIGTSDIVGVMDPVLLNGTDIMQTDIRAMELIGYDAVNRGASGDWNGIQLTQYSNDRNVALVNELEPAYTTGTNLNGTPQTAQSLGILAKDQLNADENLRLGFEVHGSISFDTPGDSDIYSFTGTAGTQVWFDISHTSPSLDTVLELIDASGNVLARSNDSVAETANPALLVGSATVSPNPLQLSQTTNANADLYTKNTKDAGMRLILPGTLGSSNIYYIRVRSNSPNLNNLTGGLTSGNYQLQIRLQEQAEVPGSTVQFANITDATDGIIVQGLPDSSPVVGTTTGVTASGALIANTTFNSAQDVGNLLASDQNMISIGSKLTDLTGQTVQWFKFTLDYQDIQSIVGASDGGKSWATIFDVDFADGLARPDLTLSVFDSLGNLMYVNRGSNVPDDQATSGSGQALLSNGSSGTLDPFLGTVQLPEGDSVTYYLAVSSDAAIPNDLGQTFNSNATNKLVRLEPIDSKQLIVEDHIGSVGSVTSDGSTLITPKSPAILPTADSLVPNPKTSFTNTVQQLSLNVVPYTLSDLGLYVSQGGGNDLQLVNAATGIGIADLGALQAGNEGINDIIMRNDGVLLGAETQNGVANTAGALAAIDPQTARISLIGKDNIPDFNNATAPFAADLLDGTQIDALTYVGNVGSPTGGIEDRSYKLYYSVRGSFAGGAVDSFLYNGDPVDGHANIIQGNRFGGPTGGDQADSEIYFAAPGDMGFTTGLASVNTTGMQLTAPDGGSVADGDTFTITDAYRTVTFEFDSDGTVTPGDVAITYTGSETAIEMAQLIADAINGAAAAGKLTDNIVAAPQGLNTAAGATNVVIISNAANGDPGTSAVQFAPIAAAQTLYGVSDTGMLYEIQTQAPGGGAGLALNPIQFQGLSFAGLAVGPQNLDLNGDGIGGDLANTLFAVTDSGDVYAIDPLTGTFRMDVFKDPVTGNPVDHISTGVGGATGLAFQPVDFNLWHPTNQNSKDPGHGLVAAPDHSTDVQYQSALPVGDDYGTTSYYFGLENYNRNTSNVNLRTYLPYTELTAAGPVAAVNAQYGVLSTQTQINLTTNSLRLNSGGSVATAYNFGGGTLIQDQMAGYQPGQFLGSKGTNIPGGAHGNLITNSFSLANSTATSLPTLYFNYYLEAQNKQGSALTDPVHVEVSTDNGATWTMVSTSNLQPNLDLPQYNSPFANIGNGNPNQVVQPLFNNVGAADPTWRQERVDLSQFAGNANVKLRFDVASAATDNNYRGFSIDDILVGNAGSGEMVSHMPPAAGTQAPAPSTGFFESPQHATAPTNPSQALTGAYELTIRRGQEYATVGGGTSNSINIYQNFSLNTRNSQSFSLMAPGAFALTLPDPATILDGDTMTISDGTNSLTFEFKVMDPLTGAITDTTAGNIGIIMSGTEDVTALANSILQAINRNFGASFAVRAALDPNSTSIYMSVPQVDPTNPVSPSVTSTNAGIAYAPQIFEGDTFTLSDGSHTRTFEFDSDNSVAAGDIAVPYTSIDSQSTVATAIAKAINAQTSSTFNLNAVAANAEVNLFGAVAYNPAGVTINLVPALPGAVSDPANPFSAAIQNGLSFSPKIADGSVFTLAVHEEQGMASMTFEFDSDGNVSGTNIPVPFLPNQPTAQVTAAIIKAINGAYDPLAYPIFATVDKLNNQVDIQVDNQSAINMAMPPNEPTGPATITTTGATSLYDYRFDWRGDTNQVHNQGEVILANNTITSASDFGIITQPSPRDSNGAHPGSVSNTVVLNGQRLAAGIVIMNNIIDSAGTGGILITGDTNQDANGNALPAAVVPFARVINNTIYGAGKGVGIAVIDNASPTLLNNILANLVTGVGVDGSSSSTVLGANLFQGNSTNTIGTTIGSFGIAQASTAPLFVNAANHNFNLLKSNTSGLVNQAIDSSLNTLQDRAAVTAVDAPLGFGPSPILAPATDATGKVRVDDPTVNPPISGLGSNVFKDRGALDRSDFLGPTAAIINPLDNSSGDQNSSLNSVLWSGGLLSNFQVQLSDGTGSGVDDSSVSAASFTLTRDGVPMVLGVDYTYNYDATNHIARFSPPSGVWASNHTYVIAVDNSATTGVKDLAANSLQPNNLSGTTTFAIQLQQLDFGSAPAPYPTTLAQDGARHILSDGLYLGSSVTASADGIPNVNADNGAAGDGVTFNGALVPGSTASVTVNVSQAGKLDAWIDFNGNGSWDAGEQIFTSTPVVAGNNVLTFNVPLTNVTSTYARFRVSTAGGLAPTGLATDGEVEDYQVNIQPTASYTVVLADPNTGTPLPKDSSGNYVVLAGQTFQAQVYVTDTRNLGATGGVAAAFADLVRDQSFVSWVTGSLQIASGFNTSQSGTINAGSQFVDEAGGVRTGSAVGSMTPELLFTVNGKVATGTAPGTLVTISTAAATGTGHDTEVFGSSTPVAGSYGSAGLIVPLDPWQNPVNPYNVDGDGFVNILDIVKLVGYLNTGFAGPSGLLPVSPVAPNLPPPYLDVDGNGFFNILDIVAEVGYINAHGFGPANPIPSPQSAAMIAAAAPSAGSGSSDNSPAAVVAAAAAPAITSSTDSSASDPTGTTTVSTAPSVAFEMSPVIASAASAAQATNTATDSLFAEVGQATPSSSATSSGSWTGTSIAQVGAAVRTPSVSSAGDATFIGPVASGSAHSHLFANYYDDGSELDLGEVDPTLAESSVSIGPPAVGRRSVFNS